MHINEQEIVEAREELYNNVVRYFRSRKGVRAIFLRGSVAQGTDDAYSDLDFGIVVESECHPQFVSERLSMPKQWGEWLFNEWIDEAIHCVSHFKPFNKVDVFYYATEHLLPSPWYTLPVQIVHDPEGIVSELVGKSRGLAFSPVTGHLEQCISRVISFAHEVYRRVRKKELIFAHAQLSNIRFMMAHLDDYLQNNPPQAVVLSRYEARGSSYIVEAFNRSHPALDSDGILSSCEVLLTAFSKQLDLLYQKFSLDRRREADEYALHMVLKLSRWHAFEAAMKQRKERS